MTDETAIALLPSSADKTTWNPQQKALMESLGLKGTKNVQRNGEWTKVDFEAPDSIVEAFIHQINRTQLDPVARQIYCIERGGKWGIQISIDGFRLVAERSKEYRGQTPAQWSDGKLYQVPLRALDGSLERDGSGNPIMVEDFRWLDAWTMTTPPAAARVGIYRDGFAEPMWAVATYDGYVALDRNGKPTGQWETNPSNQLAKCAEMLGLRKAFPQELSGLYGTEEMQQAANPRGAAPAAVRASAPAVVGPPREWAADIAAAADMAALTAIASDAQKGGHFAVLIDAPAVEGEKPGQETVEQALWRRRKEIEQPAQEPIQGTEPGKVTPRAWMDEAKELKFSEDVTALWNEAVALKAHKRTLDALAELAGRLPVRPTKGEPEEAWAPVVDEPEPAAEGPAGVLDESIEAGAPA